jgi:tetratricopeptide (TPR) repeat protein
LGYVAYYGALDYDGALKEFTAATAVEPSNGDIYEAIGFIRRRQGRWQEAAASLQKAVTLDPRSYSKVYWLAQTNLWVREYPEAERWLERAISLSPDQSDPYVATGLLYLAWQGDTARAGAALDTAANHVGVAKLTRTALLLGGGVVTRVFASRLENLLTRSSAASFGHSQEDYFLTRAMTSDALGRHSRALAYYDSTRAEVDRKSRMAPKDYYYHMLLGVADAALGNRAAAIAEAGLATRLIPGPDAPNATNLEVWLAEIDVLLGRHGEAIRHITKVLSAPHWLSQHSIQLDPIWDALRLNSAYPALVASGTPE